VDVVRATRETNQLIMGASPRGSLLLMRAAQGHAAMNGGDFVRPDDVKSVAAAVLAHRVLSRTENRAKGMNSETIINNLVSELTTPVPI
jgi:MoxR-like ATPase